MLLSSDVYVVFKLIMSAVFPIQNLIKIATDGQRAFKNINPKVLSIARKIWIVGGWILFIFGLSWFLLACDDGEAYRCGGFDTADCPAILPNILLMTQRTGPAIFILMTGLLMVWREKNQRRLALGFTAAGILLFYLMFRSFPKYC